MGLDTTHDCWHGGYSAFCRWRNKVAQVAGYAVWPVKFEDGILSDTVMIEWGQIRENNLLGHWSSLPPDPLIILIAHSDYNGIIRSDHCEPLALRLEELLPQLEKQDKDGNHFDNYAEKTKSFIQGLRVAAERQENVNFH